MCQSRQSRDDLLNKNFKMIDWLLTEAAKLALFEVVFVELQTKSKKYCNVLKAILIL